MPAASANAGTSKAAATTRKRRTLATRHSAVCVHHVAAQLLAFLGRHATAGRRHVAALLAVAQILRSPALISAGTALGVKSFAELRAKATPQARLSYASWGIGGLASVATAMQHVAAGKVVPLAMMGRERSTALPNVPTLRELGFTDPLYDASVWMAVLVPARTPPAVVQKLGSEIRAIANSPDVRKTLVERGFEMMVTTPEQAQANYKAEFDVITKRIRELGIEPQ